MWNPKSIGIQTCEFGLPWHTFFEGWGGHTALRVPVSGKKQWLLIFGETRTDVFIPYKGILKPGEAHTSLGSLYVVFKWDLSIFYFHLDWVAILLHQWNFYFVLVCCFEILIVYFRHHFILFLLAPIMMFHFILWDVSVFNKERWDINHWNKINPQLYYCNKEFVLFSDMQLEIVNIQFFKILLSAKSIPAIQRAFKQTGFHHVKGFCLSAPLEAHISFWVMLKILPFKAVLYWAWWTFIFICSIFSIIAV